MGTTHPFRFGVTLLGAASKQEWIAKVHKVEDLGYSVLQVPDHLGNQFSPTLALLAAAEAGRCVWGPWSSTSITVSSPCWPKRLPRLICSQRAASSLG